MLVEFLLVNLLVGNLIVYFSDVCKMKVKLIRNFRFWKVDKYIFFYFVFLIIICFLYMNIEYKRILFKIRIIRSYIYKYYEKIS